jgi:hypothetical protein
MFSGSPENEFSGSIYGIYFSHGKVALETLTDYTVKAWGTNVLCVQRVAVVSLKYTAKLS